MASLPGGGALGRDRVRRHVSIVIADVRRTGGVEPVVTETAHRIWLYAGGTTVEGVAVPGDLDDEQALAAVAAQVQDWEVEELDRRGHRRVWPACPLHPEHSLAPDVVAARASWTCPTGGTTAGRIGRLAAPAPEPCRRPARLGLPVPRQLSRSG